MRIEAIVLHSDMFSSFHKNKTPNTHIYKLNLTTVIYLTADGPFYNYFSY